MTSASSAVQPSGITTRTGGNGAAAARGQRDGGHQQVGQRRPDHHAGGRGRHAEHELLQAQLPGPGGPAHAERREQRVLQAAFADRGHHADHEPDAGQQPGRDHDHQQRQLRHVRQRVAEQPGRRPGRGHHGGPGGQPGGDAALRRPQPPLGDRQRRLRLRGEDLLQPGLVDDHRGPGAPGARESPDLGHQPDRDAGVAHRQRHDLAGVGAGGADERAGRDARDRQRGAPRR